MTEPVVKIPLSLAKEIKIRMMGLVNFRGVREMLDIYIRNAEREAALDKLTAIGQSMGEYEK